jgi:small-conductance mechanosensitive channel
LLRLIGARLRAARRKLPRTKAAKQRKQITFEIQRLQEMQTRLSEAPAAPVGHHHPKIRVAIHRAIKTRRQAIKRKLDPKDQRLTVKERTALLDELRDLANTESQWFGVIHKSPKSFVEYGGRFPTADHIIQNAVIQRCLKSEKPHLFLPKLAAMWPENYATALAEEIKRDPKIRRVVHRINAGQIKGEYHDPIERLIAENYFQSNKLPKPLCRLSRDEAVEQLAKHFQKSITVDKFRRHVKSLFLREYS